MALVLRQGWRLAIDSRLGRVVVKKVHGDDGTEGVDVREFRGRDLGGDVEGDGDDGENEHEDESSEGSAVGEAAEEGEFDGWQGFEEFAWGEGEEVNG